MSTLVTEKAVFHYPEMATFVCENVPVTKKCSVTIVAIVDDVIIQPPNGTPLTIEDWLHFYFIPPTELQFDTKNGC